MESDLLEPSAGMAHQRHSGPQELLFSAPEPLLPPPRPSCWGRIPRTLLFPSQGRIHGSGAREPTSVKGELAESPGGRPDPDSVRSHALRGVWQWSAGLSVFLGLLASQAASWTGDARAALLPGAPAAALAVLFLAGRRPQLRRGAMVLATSAAGFLSLATIPSLGSISLLGTSKGPAIAFQLACLGASAAFLARSAPAWRTVNTDGDRADRLLRMYDEL